MKKRILSPPSYVQPGPVVASAAAVSGSPPDPSLETATQPVFLEDAPAGKSIRVFSTLKRWRGLDVYVQIPTLTGILTLTRAVVGIYAVNGKTRSLVATGYVTADISALPPESTFRVARVRGVLAERFDVEFHYDCELPGGISSVPIYFTYCASDEAVDASDDDTVGVVAGAPDREGTFDQNLSFQASEFGVQLMGVWAQALVANRWLHIHDLDAASAAGRKPLFSFALSTSETRFEWSRMLRARRFANYLTGILSSTGDVTTPSDQVLWNLYFR